MANRCQCFNTSFVAKTSAIVFYIDNAKAPNKTNLHKLVANHLFCHELRYFETIIQMMVAFFLTEQSLSIVKDGEVIYLFLHFLLLLFCVGLLTFFLWLLFLLLLFFWLFFCYVAARFQARTS